MVDAAAAAGLRLSVLISFVAVAEERHFTRAARRVDQSSTTVSRHIRQLEAVIGEPLFARSTRTVQLTDRGRRLYAAIASSVETIHTAFHPEVASGRQTVMVAYVGAAEAQLIRDLAWRVGESDDIELQLMPAGSAMQLRGIDDGDIDVGVQWIGPRSETYEVTTLFRHPLYVAVSARHALAGRDEVDLAELEREPWLFAADRTDKIMRDWLVDTCRRHGFSPHIRDAANGNAAQLHLVAADPTGITPVHLDALARLPTSLSAFKVPDVTVKLVAVVSRTTPREVVRRIVAMLCASAAAIIPGDAAPTIPDGDTILR